MQVNNKEILIDKDCQLSEIQRVFNLYYPYLKIEFLIEGKPLNGRRTSKIVALTSLKQLSTIDEQLTIDINTYRTIAMVSDDFRNMAGVIVQVSRKSGNVWNAISFTDEWTLEFQNTAGEFITSIMAPRQPGNKVK